jgi:hypothetical protein
MIDTFASVPCATWTIADGEPQAFRGRCNTAYLARILPAVLDDAERKQRNMIVRSRVATCPSKGCRRGSLGSATANERR